MKLTTKQIHAMERLTCQGDHAQIGFYTAKEDGYFWAACAYGYAFMPGQVPDGVANYQGRIPEGLEKSFLSYFDKSGAYYVALPSAAEVKAFINLEKERIAGGRRFTEKLKSRVKPYPLENGDYLVSPFLLLDMMEIMPGASVTTDGTDQPLYFTSSSGDAYGVLMPVRRTKFINSAQDNADLVQIADEARQIASQPKPRKEKPDNMGQPATFRQLKNAILSGSVIEFTNQSGKTVTGNSLFNGQSVIQHISDPGSGKYWEFKGGYCLHYLDAAGVCRADDDITFKIRILGPMAEQTEEEKAQEAEQAARKQAEYDAKFAQQKEQGAHEEKARQEAAQREHAEKLNRDAQAIEAARQALLHGGIIRACTICTVEDGQERQENIFVHLARIYGVYLSARTKGVIYRRFSGVDIAKDGQKVRVNKRDKVTHGVLDFLFALVGAARSAAAFLGDGTKQDSTDGAETENTPQAIKNTMPGEKPVQATENRPDLQYSAYLREAITGWYKNANEDYGVSGAFLRAEAEGHDLYITWAETQDSATGMKEETIYSLMVSWYQDYTPEQVYNIWMEGDGAEVQAQRQFSVDTGDTVPEHPADTGTPEDGSLNASPDEAISKGGAGASVQAIRQKLHDAKIQLRRYACFASVSPENALHIQEQITRLQDEIQNLEDGVAELTDTS